MVRVEIISRENIKPSSPTPHHLKTFNLSLLDQLIPAPYVPIILYYLNQDSATDLTKRSEALKQSLSETLSRFYPLAGTIKDDLSIDCNDVGAYYAVARVNTRLQEFLNRPDLNLINHFLPCENGFNGSGAATRLTNVQVNVFECGGIAIGLCVSHRIVDGAAMSTFLNGWAAAARGLGEVGLNQTHLTGPCVVPANDLWLRDSSMAMWGSFFKKGKCSTKRFVFGSSTLATLKARAARAGVVNPTRVEVVSALLWKCAMAASVEKNGSQKPSILTHIVNLRKRLTSAFSENSVGNLIWIASGECKVNSGVNFHGLVEKVRGSISKINGDFVKELLGGGKQMAVMEKSLTRMKLEGADYFGFTSWCKMGFYDVDLGWGKPVWVGGSVGGGCEVFMNLVILMDTRDGDGIEAWVNLDEQEMVIFESNPELLAFASIDPSRLRSCEISKKKSTFDF